MGAPFARSCPRRRAPRIVPPQQVIVLDAARETDAVEELEDLDRHLAAGADAVTKRGRARRPVLRDEVAAKSAICATASVRKKWSSATSVTSPTRATRFISARTSASAMPVALARSRTRGGSKRDSISSGLIFSQRTRSSLASSALCEGSATKAPRRTSAPSASSSSTRSAIASASSAGATMRRSRFCSRPGISGSRSWVAATAMSDLSRNACQRARLKATPAATRAPAAASACCASAARRFQPLARRASGTGRHRARQARRRPPALVAQRFEQRSRSGRRLPRNGGAMSSTRRRRACAARRRRAARSGRPAGASGVWTVTVTSACPPASSASASSSAMRASTCSVPWCSSTLAHWPSRSPRAPPAGSRRRSARRVGQQRRLHPLAALDVARQPGEVQCAALAGAALLRRPVLRMDRAHTRARAVRRDPSPRRRAGPRRRARCR
jgi:trimeric autotransporter adhesin